MADSQMTYTMLNEREEQKLSTLEPVVVGFVGKVLGSKQRPVWTGGTEGANRKVRLLVPGQMPPVILELKPSEIRGLTPISLRALLNSQISRQVK